MWVRRQTSCDTIYTHPEIMFQVIEDHRTGKITYREKEYSSVEQAKEEAEKSL